MSWPRKAKDCVPPRSPGPMTQRTALDMGSVCRNRSAELGSASIQTDGHGSEFPEAPGNPSWGGSISKHVFLSEPAQRHCTAEDLSRQHPCLSVSMVSDLLLGDRWPIAESAADAAIAVVRQKKRQAPQPTPNRRIRSSSASRTTISIDRHNYSVRIILA